MSQRAKAAVARAMQTARFLESIGAPFEAAAVKRVCKSNSSYRTTLAQLHKDNMDLRAQLAAKK